MRPLLTCIQDRKQKETEEKEKDRESERRKVVQGRVDCRGSMVEDLGSRVWGVEYGVYSLESRV
eukprot:2813201-Rhodomonas_salina.1